jgi:hypothetical protein
VAKFPKHWGIVAQETFRKAYYIKLGAAGRYADSSISKGILRFGWASIPLAEVHAGDWTSIRERLAREHTHKSTVTMDTERLRDLVSSTPDDLWVTYWRFAKTMGSPRASCDAATPCK